MLKTIRSTTLLVEQTTITDAELERYCRVIFTVEGSEA